MLDLNVVETKGSGSMECGRVKIILVDEPKKQINVKHYFGNLFEYVEMLPRIGETVSEAYVYDTTKKYKVVDIVNYYDFYPMKIIYLKEIKNTEEFDVLKI